jgi:hypothetical protein
MLIIRAKAHLLLVASFLAFMPGLVIKSIKMNV